MHAEQRLWVEKYRPLSMEQAKDSLHQETYEMMSMLA
jgi:hypothetical protein